jgi:hypothetical protein
MRIVLTLSVSLVLGFAVVDSGSAQEAGLTAAERAWLDGLAAAGWSSTASAGGAEVRARNGALFDEPMRSALGKAQRYSRAHRRALAEVLSVTVPSAGWIGVVAVEPGRYAVGLRQGRRNLELVYTDARGRELGAEGIVVYGHTSALPSVSARSSDGIATLTAAWGGVELRVNWRARQDHDRLFEGMAEHGEGALRIISDLPEHAPFAQLLADFKPFIQVQERFTGLKLPGGTEFRLYLVAAEEPFVAADRFLTDGQFLDHGAFTSNISRASYIRYAAYTSEAAFEGIGFPLRTRALVLHELHHQFMSHALPDFRFAPAWLHEALAEYAAELALRAVAPELGQAVEDKHRARVSWLAESGASISAEDLIAGLYGGGRGAFYAACHSLGRALAAKPGPLSSLLLEVAQHTTLEGAAEAARLRTEEAWGTVSGLLAAGGAAPHPVRLISFLDREGEAWRVASEIEKGAYSLLPGRLSGPDFVFQGEFRMFAESSGQVDLLFAHAAGRESERFAKLSILPARVVLFRFENGYWTTAASVDYDTPLDRAAWHSFTLRYDAGKRELRFETTGGRWARFQLHWEPFPRGSRLGIGCHSGVAWFRNLAFE